MELTAENVDKMLRKCLFPDNEAPDPNDTDKFIRVEGVLTNFGFKPEGIEEQKGNIKSLLLQLPDTFRESIGGGWSFLNACMTQEGVQWGEHRDIEILACLGIAAGYAKWLIPRELWPVLPGGMPYFVVLDRAVEEENGN